MFVAKHNAVHQTDDARRAQVSMVLNFKGLHVHYYSVFDIHTSTYICTVLSSEERMNVKHTQHTVRNVRRAIVRLLLQTTARKIPPLVPYGIVRRTVQYVPSQIPVLWLRVVTEVRIESSTNQQ
jgi:hypothetical protein